MKYINHRQIQKNITRVFEKKVTTMTPHHGKRKCPPSKKTPSIKDSILLGLR